MSDADEPYRGMAAYEREAVQRALHETREKWLPVLEARLAKADDPDERSMLIAEVRRLRRLLGIFQTAEARRAGNRERVRRHRERKQQGVAPAPPVTAEQILDELEQQLAFQREIEAKQRSPDGQ